MFPLNDLHVLLDICLESGKHSILLVGSHSTGTLEVLQELLFVNSTVKMTERFPHCGSSELGGYYPSHPWDPFLLLPHSKRHLRGL
jgi:hypothetical protein